MFKELGKYSTFFYHLNERMKCIEIEDGLRLELKNTIGILKNYKFYTFIHNCRLFKDFKNNQNRPWSNTMTLYKEEKSYNRSQ